MTNKKITVKRKQSKDTKHWDIYLEGSNIGHMIIMSDGDWTGRIKTMSSEHFDSALELISAELAEEALMENT